LYPLTVEIKLNGVEVDFDEFVQACADNLSEMVEKRAQQIVRSRMQSFLDRIYDLERQAESLLKGF